MSIRFNKRLKVAPGVRLNVGLKGVSTTLGAKGLSVNLGKDGTHLNAGLPGTGLSTRKKLSGSKPHSEKIVSQGEEKPRSKGNSFGLVLTRLVC